MPKKKKVEKMDLLKNEYKSLGELIEKIPDGMMVFKRDTQIYDRKTKRTHDKLILIYQIAEKRNSHFGERTTAYMRDKETGKVRMVDQERLQKELGAVLMKHFDKKMFMEDFMMTLTPMELLEAYDRAVVKKGKVKHIEGCSKFRIYGAHQPMELMLRN